MNADYDYDYKPKPGFHSGVNSLVSSTSSVGQHQSYIFDTPKTLQVEAHVFSKERQITLDGQTLFTISGKTLSLSGFTTIRDSKGEPVCNYTHKHHCFSPNTFFARDGDDKSTLWDMNVKHSGASAKVNTISVNDRNGSTGSEQLQFVQKHRSQLEGELVRPGYGVVAKAIHTSKWMAMKKFEIEVMPGMDLLLAVSIIAAVQDKVWSEQVNANIAISNSNAAAASASAAAAASVS